MPMQWWKQKPKATSHDGTPNKPKAASRASDDITPKMVSTCVACSIVVLVIIIIMVYLESCVVGNADAGVEIAA